jgi:hypothetical protein
VKRRLQRYAHDAGRLDRMLHSTSFEQDVRLLGHGWSPRVHELKRFPARSGVRFRWFDLDIEGDAEVRRIIAEAGSTSQAFPIVHRYLEETFGRPAGDDREATSASMTAAASASGRPS